MSTPFANNFWLLRLLQLLLIVFESVNCVFLKFPTSPDCASIRNYVDSDDGLTSARIVGQRPLRAVNCGGILVQELPNAVFKINCTAKYNETATIAELHSFFDTHHHIQSSVLIKSCPVPHSQTISVFLRHIGIGRVTNFQLKPNHNHEQTNADRFKSPVTSGTSVEWFYPESSRTMHLLRDTFNNMTDLRNLNLAHCRIVSMQNDVFADLTNLHALLMNDNNILEWTADVFREDNQLALFDLSNNGMNVIGANVFVHLTKLETLNLSGNNFKTLPNRLLDTASRLVTFELNSNKAESLRLPSSFLANKPNLEFVSMSNARLAISERDFDLFENSTALLNVSLSFNNIASLPNNLFATLLNLEYLDLSENYLEDLDDGLFKSTPLIDLRLSHNRLKQLESSVFGKDNYLQELWLDNNRIRHVALADLRDLRILLLHNNKIETIDNVVVHDFNQFDKITFSGNPAGCDFHQNNTQLAVNRSTILLAANFESFHCSGNDVDTINGGNAFTIVLNIMITIFVSVRI